MWRRIVDARKFIIKKDYVAYLLQPSYIFLKHLCKIVVSVLLIVAPIFSSNFLNSMTHFRTNMAKYVKPPVPGSTQGTGFLIRKGVI
jgi:hypothetical protein